MIKKEIYPKTPRMLCQGNQIEITEKLDGSNLVIFKYDGNIYIAQRNTILTEEEIENNKGILYKGLYQWLADNIEVLKADLHEGSAICGEWLGEKKNLKYTVDEFDKRYYMFAKGRIEDETFTLTNIQYSHENFKYVFDTQEIPSFIGIVPVVTYLPYIPNKLNMDSIYESYCEKVNRNVEGFVINYCNIITKYVRMKKGKLAEHFDRLEVKENNNE